MDGLKTRVAQIAIAMGLDVGQDRYLVQEVKVFATQHGLSHDDMEGLLDKFVNAFLRRTKEDED